MRIIRKINKLFRNFLPVLFKSNMIYALPSLYRYFEIKPSSAIVFLTNRCNLRCVMCRQWRDPVKEELTGDEWVKVMKDLSDNGIINVHFSGGEPLLKAELNRIISECNRLGMTTGITTNGVLLEEKTLDQLLRSGLSSLAVSIDAVNEAYDQIRGSYGAFDKMRKGLSVVSSLKKDRRLNAYINFTLMKNSIKHLKDVKRLADDLGLPVGICLLDCESSIFKLEENKNSFWISESSDFEALDLALRFLMEEKLRAPGSLILEPQDLKFIKDYFADPVQQRVPCISSQDRIIIDPYGNVMGGCLSMGVFGNVKRTSIAGISGEAGYVRAKRNMFYKKCAGCSCGYLFNLRFFLPYVFYGAYHGMKQRARAALWKRSQGIKLKK